MVSRIIPTLAVCLLPLLGCVEDETKKPNKNSLVLAETKRANRLADEKAKLEHKLALAQAKVNKLEHKVTELTPIGKAKPAPNVVKKMGDLKIGQVIQVPVIKKCIATFATDLKGKHSAGDYAEPHTGGKLKIVKLSNGFALCEYTPSPTYDEIKSGTLLLVRLFSLRRMKEQRAREKADDDKEAAARQKLLKATKK